MYMCALVSVFMCKNEYTRVTVFMCKNEYTRVTVFSQGAKFFPGESARLVELNTHEEPLFFSAT